MKIAGYMLTFEYLEWGGFEPKVDTAIVHRQCAWNYQMLGSDNEREMVKILVEQAEQHTCEICEKKLSEPAYFAFQTERIC